MVYPLILRAFLFLVLAGGCSLAVCAALPSLRTVLPPVRYALLCGLAGFVGANLVSAAIGLLPALVAGLLDLDPASRGSQVASGFVLAGLYFGPLIASPLGFLAGLWYALRRSGASRAPRPVLSLIRALRDRNPAEPSAYPVPDESEPACLPHPRGDPEPGAAAPVEREGEAVRVPRRT